MGTCRRVLLKLFSVILPLLLFVISPLAAPGPDLTFEDRVAAQAAIERVYYAHQIGATKPFEEAVLRAVLEEKVRTYLKKSVALEKVWHVRITGETLRFEVERMAQSTRMPERLREIFDALGNDPLLVQECLARPILVNRLVRERFAFDKRLHESARHQAEDLREQLMSGRLSMTEADPRRAVVEYNMNPAERRRGAQQSPVNVEDNAAAAHGVVASPPGGGHEMAAEAGVMTIKSTPEEFATQRSSAPAMVGEVGEVSEDLDAFVIRTLLEENAVRFRVATYRVPKTTWQAWFDGEKDRFNPDQVPIVATDLSRLPSPEAGFVSTAAGCSQDNTWEPTLIDGELDPGLKPGPAVWTGSVMIKWGGTAGAKYDPATDSWVRTSPTKAIPGLDHSTAVWTGSEMIVFGGNSGITVYDLGGRYDPVSDTWSSLGSGGGFSPSARAYHTAVWTGSEMIIWGGYNGFAALADGARYNPISKSWAPMAGNNPPRFNHTAVWTGSEMIVWGGGWNQGARYNPVTNLWTTMSAANAPASRDRAQALWTGSRMLIWCGAPGGGAYDPASDSWTAIPTANAPPGEWCSAVWTGSEMIAWGGNTSEGGRYNPGTNTWSPTSTVGAPSPRYDHAAVWTGSLMVIWGGTGPGVTMISRGRYDPVLDAWLPGRPYVQSRSGPSAVWTGNEMIVWGGGHPSGDRYDPATNSWSPISITNSPQFPLGVPGPPPGIPAVWTGSQMIVWGGGFDGGGYDMGGRYEPLTDTWSPTTMLNAPSARYQHTAVWTGSEMIVWGGRSSAAIHFNSGAKYNPVSDIWTPMIGAAPAARGNHSAVWTGSRMIVWGGYSYGPMGYQDFDSGGIYDPVSNSWSYTSLTGAPSPRSHHTAVWTGSRMVVWGGYTGLSQPAPTYLVTGARYDPATNTWESTTVTNAPSGRTDFSAVWANGRMIVFGGNASDTVGGTVSGSAYFYSFFSDGGRYDPTADSWGALPTLNAPARRAFHSALFTGSQMIVWGGTNNLGGFLNVNLAAPDDDADGFPICAGDCDDTRAAVYPGAPQICDGVNDNCSDPAWPALPAPEPDDDGDGYYVCADDCNDLDPFIHPGAPERCNGLDDSCDTTVPSVENDADHDGYRICAGDCDDTRSQVHPGAPEICNGIDDDCNGLPTSEQDSDQDGVRPCSGDCDDTRSAVYPGAPQICDGVNDNCSDPGWPALPSPEADADGDGYFVCAESGDCNDGDPLIHAGAQERCNGLDDNCDTVVPSQENDADADGYRGCSGDCDDAWNQVHPGAPEICNGIDDDCDASIPANETDADSDGVRLCQNDCNDSDFRVWAPPGEVEAVIFTSATSATFQPPSSPGSTSIVYDVIRSSSKSNFMTGATCPSTNGTGTSFSAVLSPSLGQAFFYLVRAENACPQGSGPVGNQSNGTPRTARTCP